MANSAVPAAATSAEGQLDNSLAAFPTPAPPAAAAEAVGTAVAPCGAAASVPLALGDVATGADADNALQGRPASAFAHVAELPAPVDWQASKQMGLVIAEQLTCAELTGADTQPVRPP